MAKKDKDTAVLPQTETQTEREYFVGTLPDCPMEHLSIGGVMFPSRSETVRHDEETNTTQRNEQIGSVVRLTDEKADAVRAAAYDKFVRGGRLIVTKNGPRYRAMHGDEPVAKFVFMVAADGLGISGRNSRPASIYEMDHGK